MGDLPATPGRLKQTQTLCVRSQTACLLWYFKLAASTNRIMESCAVKQTDVPLGDLQGVGERRLSLEGLFIKKALDGVVGQLLHDDKGLVEVQQHGEVVILPVSQDVDALGQENVGGFLQPPHLVPGDDQFYCRFITMT